MKRWHVFPGIVFALLAVNAGIVFATIYLANSDDSFAVEPEYYQKAVRWDERAADRARAESLGWTAQVRLVDDGGHGVRVTIVDAASNAVPGVEAEVVAFPAARASERRRLELTRLDDGAFVAPFSPTVGGVWEFEVRASDGDVVFEERVSLMLLEKPR